jgi:ParB-like chromosome segregation protein Spo0J
MANKSSKQQQTANVPIIMKLLDVKRDIVDKPGWNARSDARTTALGSKDKEGVYGPDNSANKRDVDDTECALGVDGLAADMAKNGQLQPILVRPEGLAGKYSVIAGFKRLAAVRLLAASKTPVFGEEPGQIRVEVVHVTELGARSVNLRENFARNDLVGPDSCYGIAAYVAAYQAENEGRKPSSVFVAQELGISQSHANRCLHINAGLDPDVFAKWRDSDAPIATITVASISDKPHAEQMKLYTEKVDTKTSPPAKLEGDAAWQQKCKDEATTFAQIVAAAVAGGFFPVSVASSFTTENARDNLRSICLRMPATMKDGSAIPAAVEKDLAAVVVKAYVDEVGAIASRKALAASKAASKADKPSKADKGARPADPSKAPPAGKAAN